MESSEEKPRVKCTYAGCDETWSDEKAMKRHKDTMTKDKANTPDLVHWYCKRCDFDGMDYDDLLQHKLDAMAPFLYNDCNKIDGKGPDHIVCEFCGEDFKCGGGRLLHRKKVRRFNPLPRCLWDVLTDGQMHQEDQQIRCKGEGMVWRREKQKLVLEQCCGIFAKPSGLIKHIEQGWCEFITREQLHKAREQKLVVKEIMKDPDTFCANLSQSKGLEPYMPGTPSISMRGGEDDEDSIELSEGLGGVSLAPDLLTGPTPAGPHIPSLKPKPAITNIMDDDTPAGGVSIAVAKPDWVAIKQSHAYEKKQDARTNLLYARFWDPTSPDYNKDLFFHLRPSVSSNAKALIGAYECPFADCNATYEFVSDLEIHMSATHICHVILCPCCKHRFRDLTAIMQHFEASQAHGKKSCRVARSADYEQFVTEMTGGLLEASRVEYEEKIVGYGKGGEMVKTGHQGAVVAKGVMGTSYEATEVKKR